MKNSSSIYRQKYSVVMRFSQGPYIRHLALLLAFFFCLCLPIHLLRTLIGLASLQLFEREVFREGVLIKHD